jgi:hypothetical protein
MEENVIKCVLSIITMDEQNIKMEFNAKCTALFSQNRAVMPQNIENYRVFNAQKMESKTFARTSARRYRIVDAEER